jgi:hypothetical protein
MSVDQRTGFEERRLELMRKHFDKSPVVKAYYRKRRRALLGGFLGSLAFLVLGLLLLKSFMLAYEGPNGYAQITAPAMAGRPPDSLVLRLIGPDPISTEIASILAPILPKRANRGTSAPPAVPAPMAQQDAPLAAANTMSEERPDRAALPAPAQETPRPRAVLQLTD